MSDTAPRKKICLECHRYPCACATAPQPPPVPTESEQFDMHLRQSTKKDGVEIEAVMRANNRGFRADIWAKHPEFTQWIGEIVSEVFSDHGAVNFLTFEATSPKIGRFEITIQRAEGETTAQRMGRDQARIAALEAQLAAVQQANVMARDIADQANQRAEKAERELAEAQERADEFEERWLGYPKAEEANVKRLQELQRKRAAETATPAEVEEYERLLTHVRTLSPRMNSLFAPAGSLSVEEIIDSLLASAQMDTLAGRYKTLKEMYAEAQERLAMAVEALEKIHKGACLTAQESRSRDDDRYCIGDVIQVSSKALAATAATVAQHTASVERRGAAKELRRLADDWHHMDPNDAGVRTPCANGCTKCELLARAAELEGA